MAKLFDIIKSEIILHPQVLAVPALKKIWDRDKVKNKEKAYKEISYIVFMYDFHSPYKDLAIYERDVTVKKHIFNDVKWAPDEAIIEAIGVYRLLQETPLTRLLEANLNNVDKLTEYLNNINFRDKNLEDAAKTADGLIKSMEKIGGIVKSLSMLKKQVQTEVAESVARGNTEIGLYELPD